MLRNRPGFSVLELLVSLTILGVVMASLFSVILQTQQDYANQWQGVQDQENLRAADLMIRTVMRNAAADPFGTNQTLMDPDPLNTDQWNSLRSRSDYNPVNGSFDDALEDVTLKVQSDTLFLKSRTSGSYEPYVYPIRSMKFEWYNRSGVLITSESEVRTANRVRVILMAPPNPVTGDTLKRETWIFLRNRR